MALRGVRPTLDLLRVARAVSPRVEAAGSQHAGWRAYSSCARAAGGAAPPLVEEADGHAAGSRAARSAGHRAEEAVAPDGTASRAHGTQLRLRAARLRLRR